MGTGMMLMWQGDKGFGFIRPDMGDESELLEGEGSVQDGDRVSFVEAYDHRKEKMRATEVKAEDGGRGSTGGSSGGAASSSMAAAREMEKTFGGYAWGTTSLVVSTGERVGPADTANMHPDFDEQAADDTHGWLQLDFAEQAPGMTIIPEAEFPWFVGLPPGHPQSCPYASPQDFLHALGAVASREAAVQRLTSIPPGASVRFGRPGPWLHGLYIRAALESRRGRWCPSGCCTGGFPSGGRWLARFAAMAFRYPWPLLDGDRYGGEELWQGGPPFKACLVVAAPRVRRLKRGALWQKSHQYWVGPGGYDVFQPCGIVLTRVEHFATPESCATVIRQVKKSYPPALDVLGQEVRDARTCA